MRNRIVVLAMAVMAVAMWAATAAPVFAQGGHTSCKAFGQGTAGFAKSEHPFGQQVRGLAPANRGVHAEQELVCEPKS
jgi:Cu/Zn superoxide dismutase